MEIQPFLDYITAEKRYSRHTITSYGKDLEQFQVFLRLQYSQESIDNATFNQIRSWIVYQVNEGIAPRSVNRKVSTLRSYYKFLLRKGKIRSNPTDGLQGPKVPKRNPVFVPESSMNILFDQLQFPDDFEGVRDRMILELFYFTGMRRAELLQLKITDIDFYNQYIRVFGKRSKERLIPMASVLQRSLEQYIAARNTAFTEDTTGLLFLNPKGKKFDPKMIYVIVKRYLSSITTIEKKSPHVLRHTFATHMLNNGADINAIKEILGHASLAATEVYTHNTLEKIKNIYKKAHPRA